MKGVIPQVCKWLPIAVVLSGSQSGIALPAADLNSTFTVKTYDGLELPANVSMPPVGSCKKLVIFIQGSTPYDEHGFEGPFWDENGSVIRQKNDFYHRFLDIMPAKGYASMRPAFFDGDSEAAAGGNTGGQGPCNVGQSDVW